MVGDTDNKKAILSKNYIIIIEMWKFIKLNKVSTLYKNINIDRNKYSDIVNEKKSINLQNNWHIKIDDNDKNDVGLFVLGLQKDYMYGNKLIEVDCLTKGEIDYVKLKKAFEKLREEGLKIRSRNAIDRLYYYCVKGERNLYEIERDFEILELNKQLELIGQHQWNDCEINLLKKTVDNFKRKLREAEITYEYRVLNQDKTGS